MSPEDHAEITAKLRFFEGEAWTVYIQEIKPALVEVTREEIEMPPEYLGAPAGSGQTGSVPESRDPTAFFNRMLGHPNYIDNNMKEIHFYTAELAVIDYRDGSSLELGLVPRWMKSPFEEVDYHTPREGYRPLHDAKTGLSLFRESDLQDVPRNMSWAEVQKRYAKPVSFVVEPKSARIVPSRVNTLTAPTLCRVLLESEMQFAGRTKEVAEMGQKVAGIMVYWAGAGGWAKGPGTLVKPAGARVAASLPANPVARKLAGEFDTLLTTGASKTITAEGMEFAGVQVTRQGRALVVRREGSEIAREALRGQGLGGRMNAAFEEAAVATARMNGLKTVTIDVGRITNPGWREFLEARGYVMTRITTAEGDVIINWIKTITL